MKHNRKKRYFGAVKGLFWTSVVFFLINAATFPLMPIAVDIAESTSAKLSLVILGLVFWLSVLLGFVFLILANGYRRKYVRNFLNGDVSMGSRIGIFTFFSTIPGIIFDSLFILSLAALLIAYFEGSINHYISYVLLAIWDFSLNMHGMFNGRIFKFIQNKHMIERGKDNE